MYIISNCSIAISIAICYIVSTIIGSISFNCSLLVLILSAASTIVILHAMIYVGSLPYIVISFTLLTLLTILFTQLMILPQYKEHKQKEADELIAQIKKEQGYR